MYPVPSRAQLKPPCAAYNSLEALQPHAQWMLPVQIASPVFNDHICFAGLRQAIKTHKRTPVLSLIQVGMLSLDETAVERTVRRRVF
jgi:hypothetical protein